MAREIIHTDGAPSSPLYAQGVRAGETIWLSGMVGIDAATAQLAGASVGEQTRQAVANCAAVLAAEVRRWTTSSRSASCSPSTRTSPR